jgi:hypothetical protein
LIGEDTDIYGDDDDREVQEEDARQAPHTTISDFYREYAADCKDKGCQCGSESTFRSGYKELYKLGAVRLMGSKSGFTVCPLCTNCHNILGGASGRRDPVIKEVTHALKRHHIKMQHHERQHAENVIRECKKVVNGKPVSFYCDIDGMTVITCNTPRWRKGRKVVVPHVFENRNIGARLICGPVDKYISINTNDLIPGGANVLVEVTRLCVEIMAELLHEHNLELPKKGYFQYDNSGEQKVRLYFEVSII